MNNSDTKIFKNYKPHIICISYLWRYFKNFISIKHINSGYCLEIEFRENRRDNQEWRIIDLQCERDLKTVFPVILVDNYPLIFL
jgi:hypothetical protein